ncbi:MAG: hypothetical protein RR827_02085 [Oscillospiraceae bacterium]
MKKIKPVTFIFYHIKFDMCKQHAIEIYKDIKLKNGNCELIELKKLSTDNIKIELKKYNYEKNIDSAIILITPTIDVDVTDIKIKSVDKVLVVF